MSTAPASRRLCIVDRPASLSRHRRPPIGSRNRLKTTPSSMQVNAHDSRTAGVIETPHLQARGGHQLVDLPVEMAATRHAPLDRRRRTCQPATPGPGARPCSTNAAPQPGAAPRRISPERRRGYCTASTWSARGRRRRPPTPGPGRRARRTRPAPGWPPPAWPQACAHAGTIDGAHPGQRRRVVGHVATRAEGDLQHLTVQVGSDPSPETLDLAPSERQVDHARHDLVSLEAHATACPKADPGGS